MTVKQYRTLEEAQQAQTMFTYEFQSGTHIPKLNKSQRKRLKKSVDALIAQNRNGKTMLLKNSTNRVTSASAIIDRDFGHDPEYRAAVQTERNMKPFDLATYESLGELGYSTEDARNAIHEYYEGEAIKLITAAETRGKQSGVRKQELWGRGMLYTLYAVIGLIFVSLPIYFHQSGMRQAEQRVAACSAGNTIGCYGAVNYELRQAIDNHQSGQTIAEREHRDEAARLLLAYRERTGHTLPTK